MYGNPLRYIDPTGHGTECGFGESCVVDPYTSPILSTKTVNNTGNAKAGSSEEDEGIIEEAAEIPSCGYHHCGETFDVFEAYELGWQNFGQAWNIYWNPNASFGQRLLSYGYMSVWGQAHAMLLIGSSMLAWEALLGIGAQLATKNPDAPAVLIGRFKSSVDSYMTQAGKNLTYFNLGKHYGWLNKIGLANPINQKFMIQQMQKGKDFLVYGSEYLKPGGEGLRMEINMLFNYGYTEFGNAGMSVYNNIFQLIP